jgi:hypothetical protein
MLDKNPVNATTIRVDSMPSAELLSPETLETVLTDGVRLHDDVRKLSNDVKYLEEQIHSVQISNPSDPSENEYDEIARARRGAIYGDALREAAISGDRLWAFVQQLSGTTGESVEDVCVIDETGLQKQQRDRTARRVAASKRAADAYVQIVRSVVQSTLQDSGLKFGIGEQADGFVVKNTTLQKRARELVDNPPANVGFFANSVDLEALLTQSKQELSLSDVLGQLGNVGLALQRASETMYDKADDRLGGASLEFLRVPRNSLFIQWKDEAKAAIRRAFDIFTREWQTRRDCMHVRQIRVYELMEGVDAALCSYFAEFCGFTLTALRMQNPKHAVYVSVDAARTNGLKMKVSLQRLVNAAVNYVSTYAGPGTSRSVYFGQAGNGYNTNAFVVPRAAQAPRSRAGWQSFP